MDRVLPLLAGSAGTDRMFGTGSRGTRHGGGRSGIAPLLSLPGGGGRGFDPCPDAATDMADGKTFCIYAFPAGASTTTTEPLDHKVYTVKGGVATGELYLYRGTYDLYLVSYNSSTEVPELKTDGTIQVSNGKDFMYTSLKGIVVQPNQTGENMMDVVLPAPFKRLGAQIKVSVAAGDFQPVTPTSLVVNSFEMGGLRASLPYTLGGTTWGAVANETFATTQSFTGFTNNTASHDIKTSRESTPVVVLPVDGSAMISFKVNLTVGYNVTV